VASRRQCIIIEILLATADFIVEYMSKDSAIFRALPAVSKVLQAEALRSTISALGEEIVKEETRNQLAGLRRQLSAGDEAALDRLGREEFLAEFCESVARCASAAVARPLVNVINLSGTVLHTNLGRARLPTEAVAALGAVAGESCNLEFDLDTGSRGDRDQHVEAQLCALTGAEAATVVNNNAAAVLLVLSSLCEDKEALISRGELVEIGGSFRIPEIMRSARARLREVGTTNRTHLADYADAIGADTGLLMKVHTSNYAIQGFTASVDDAPLSALGREHGIPYVSDLGSGTLVDLRLFGLPHEPTVKETLAAGADLVTFSGDKLLGGPQAGIIAGRADLVARVKRNHLKRALRVDKLTLAALYEVLVLYRDPDRLRQRLPLLRDLTRAPEDIRAQAERLQPLVQRALGTRAQVSIASCRSQIGSGALPIDLLPSTALVIAPVAATGGYDTRLVALAEAFRRLPTPVVGRLHDGRFYLDLRCLADTEVFSSQLTSLLP